MANNGPHGAANEREIHSSHHQWPAVDFTTGDFYSICDGGFTISFVKAIRIRFEVGKAEHIYRTQIGKHVLEATIEEYFEVVSGTNTHVVVAMWTLEHIFTQFLDRRSFAAAFTLIPKPFRNFFFVSGGCLNPVF